MPDQGYLLQNLLVFGRLLREAGIPVTPGQIRNLAECLSYIDPADRRDFFNTSRCLFVHCADDLALFERAFALFWDQKYEFVVDFSPVTARRSRSGEDRQENPDSSIPSRILPEMEPPPEQEQLEPLDKLQPAATYSPVEVLQYKDFADLSEEEILQVESMLRRLSWRNRERRSRRKVRSLKQTSRIDLRGTIRQNITNRGEMIDLAYHTRKTHPRPLVMICDISGSMERYTRIFLRLMYHLVQAHRKVETFVFGTRLTCITPALRHRKVDQALSRASELVCDWSGGTRIGESLREFNYRWSRRVLRNGAVVMILSDGWERGNSLLLRKEISRLKRSASKLIWLNPLLGNPDYQPLVQGIQAALPYVDEFLPLHNLESVARLTGDQAANHLTVSSKI
jgi:uncharacterized protein with von Willebrand factor type A (vWA) domain